MEESIVALMMILGLGVADVVYFNSKTSGGYDALCYFIQPSTLTSDMEAYLKSPAWQKTVYWDSLLYQAANHSLDLTISSLGPTRFSQELAKFQSLQKAIHESCNGLEVFPCRSDGTKNLQSDCLWNDSGCGRTCISEYLQNHGYT